MEELLTKGLFITFEGPDASGKTTQIKLLSSFLKRKGLEVLVTREPGGTDIGEKIRKILLDKKHYSMEYKTEALLFLASRAEHTSKVIKPALKEGRIVISDRFFDSTVVYQGIARGLGKEKIIDMSLWATGGLVPNITFLLLIGVSGGEERIKINNK
ncbi:MAG: dTMP kinase, partial [Actinobacteria bacterium]|nr:dTMP kinase [Actinomycetota bacterium]